MGLAFDSDAIKVDQDVSRFKTCFRCKAPLIFLTLNAKRHDSVLESVVRHSLLFVSLLSDRIASSHEFNCPI
jgi:hypothetical protein